MVVVCISCFNYYSTQMRSIINYFNKLNYNTTYVISDFNHFSKERFKSNYENTIQIRVPEYKKNLSPLRLYSHYVFSKKTYKLIEQIAPDIIFCMLPPNSLTKEIIRYKNNHNVKVVFDCYDMWPESFPYSSQKSILSFPFKKWRELRDKYINKCDCLLCVSDEMIQQFKDKFPDLLIDKLLPMIDKCDLPSYNFFFHDQLTFCYLGNINHITDIELGVQLLSGLAKKRKVVLHIIGEGINYGVFYERLSSSGITVIGHGVVFEKEDKRKIFEQCDFGLNIPREEINSTLSLKFVEYTSVGLPVVNSGAGECYEIIDKQEIGININKGDFYKTINEILELKKQNLIEMHNNCINYYKKNHSEERLGEIFKKILN